MINLTNDSKEYLISEIENELQDLLENALCRSPEYLVYQTAKARTFLTVLHNAGLEVDKIKLELKKV